MKLDGKVKILCLVTVVLFVIALIILAIKGFNFDLMYKAHEEIDVVIGKDFELSDVKKITDEVFKNKKVVLRKIELFEDAVAIDVEYATEEEMTALKDKMNEVYGLELEEVKCKQISNISAKDIIMPYVLPCVISLAIVLVFVAIKYRKLSKKAMIKEPLSLLATLAMVEILLSSIVVIARIPFSKMVLPVLVICGFITCMVWIEKEENKMLSIEDK